MANMQTQSQEQNAYRYQTDNSGDIGVDVMFRDKDTVEVRKQTCYDMLSAAHKLSCHNNFYNRNDGVWVNWGVLAMAKVIKQQWYAIQLLEYGPEYYPKEKPWAKKQRRNSLKHQQSQPGDADNDWEPKDGGVYQRTEWASKTWEKAKMPQAGTSSNQLDFFEGRFRQLNEQLASLAIRVEEANEHYDWMREAYFDITDGTPYKPYTGDNKTDLVLPDITPEMAGIDAKAAAMMATKTRE